MWVGSCLCSDQADPARLQSIHPRAKRSPTIPAHLRLIFDSARSVPAGTPEAAAFARQVDDMVVFLKAHRLHKVRPSLLLSRVPELILRQTGLGGAV